MTHTCMLYIVLLFVEFVFISGDVVNVEYHITYSAKLVIDVNTSSCSLKKPIYQSQVHRLITTPSKVHIISRRQNTPDSSEQLYVEIFGGSVDALKNAISSKCPNGLQQNQPLMTSRLRASANDGDEVIKIVDSGDPSNRIDVVFMGDGYTINQRGTFVSDIKRLTQEMFSGKTFAAYLPLFNIWGFFRPSAEAGIGSGGTTKDTAFGLYRDGTELRAIYTSKGGEAHAACDSVGKDACDYPSLIANDDYYGGLGGEFVISTKSERSGTIVLRHEMGHSFGEVGEEYDGGYVYAGANSAPSLSKITWKHWLTVPEAREEQSHILVQAYPWYDLSKGKYSLPFTADGTFKRWVLQLSISGADTNNSVSITLDGKDLNWETRGTKDRIFYEIRGNYGFSAGSHELVVKGGDFDLLKPGDMIRQFCSATLIEYMGEDKFLMDNPDEISAYPTWDINDFKTYRPDNEKCLMRNMTSTSFCKVCKENLWLKFFARMNIIDSVIVNNTANNVHVEAKVVPLAQFRSNDDPFPAIDPESAAGEKFEITWEKANIHQQDLDGKFVFDMPIAMAAGKWKVTVVFKTPMVRRDERNLLTFTKIFQITT